MSVHRQMAGGAIPRLLFFVAAICVSVPTLVSADQLVPRARIGVASWYGPGFHNRRTASGVRFNMHDMTGAHPTLPLGTAVRVTNLRNGRSVQITINDRGPYRGRRILDVSYGAARELGMISRGVERVLVEPLL